MGRDRNYTDVNSNEDNVAITSIDGGVTWVLGFKIGESFCAQIILYNVLIPTSAYNLFIYDDCCHLFSSFDLGQTWAVFIPKLWRH